MATEFKTIDLKVNNFLSETYENGILTETFQDNKTEDFKEKFLNKDTLKYFRSLGGTETIKQGKKFNLGCTVSTSISPDKKTKKIRYFFY